MKLILHLYLRSTNRSEVKNEIYLIAEFASLSRRFFDRIEYMKVIHKNQAETFKNSDVCTAIEYPLGDKDINGAIIELSGRYPDRGMIVNLKCKELAYVIEGSGKVVVEGKEIEIDKGDLVLIEPGEKYFWEGNLTMFVPCIPAWYPEQHKKVE